MDDCRTCDLLARRDRGEAPPWDAIARTDHWDVVHCDASSIEGWLVLVCRRHVPAVAELTEHEAAALGPLLRRTSIALADAVGCVKTYVAQFAESPHHRHVHVHVVPRSADHPTELVGPAVFGALGVDDDQRVPEHRMNEVAAAVAASLSRTSS